MIDFAHEIPRSPVTTPAEPVRTKRRPATRVGPARRAVAVESPAPSPSPPTSAPPSSAPEPFPPADLVRLGDEIAELAAHLHAATYRLLVLVREFDQRGGWHTGFRSCAHWLSWRTGIAMGPAREKVRVAEALERLPLLSERMRSGQLSYSKVRALTRVATADNERELMEFALHGTASHVERLVRAWKRVDRLEEQWQERERHRARSLTLYADEDGMYVIRGRLDPEVGALLMRALKAAGETLYGRSGGAGRSTNGDLPSDSSEVEPLTAPQRRADAIGLLAERGLQAGLGSSPADVTKTDAEETDDVSPTQDSGTAGQRLAQGAERVGTTPIGRDDRFQVVVHVDAEALRESSEVGECMLEGDVHVPAGTVPPHCL